MNGRTAVPATCIAALTLALGTVATAGAVGSAGGRHVHPPQVTTGGRMPRASSSPFGFALMSIGVRTTEFAGEESAQQLFPGGMKSFSTAADITATAMDATGRVALVAGESARLYTLRIGRALREGPDIPLGQYAGEGDPTFDVTSDGVAIVNRAALVAVGEKGVVQLREKGRQFSIDTRVHSPGNAETGTPHVAGFIRIPGSVSRNVYGGVTVSRVPLPNGKYLGLAIDRSDQALAVIEGVGTARPRVVGQLVSSDLSTPFATTADGGMEFSPATATRAVVVTPNGVDVLNLTHPKHPVLESPTTIGSPDSTNAVTVSPDGDSVAASNLSSVYIVRGLLRRHGTSLQHVGSFMPFGIGFDPHAIAFTPNNKLLVQYDALDDTQSHIEALSLYTGVTTTGLPMGEAKTTLDGAPESDNTMSVAPVFPPRLHPSSLGRHLRVGKRMHVGLSVVGIVGRYRFRVSHGPLPAGLHLRHRAITGRPKHAGRSHITITAVNQYGGAVIANRLLRIHR